jgi:CoA:oxalate CoA-transferase
VIERPELQNDERFDTNSKRVQRHAEIKPIVEAWTNGHSINEIVDRMLAAGVPSAPINTIDRLVTDPHIAVAREMFVDVEHPKAGVLKLTGVHIKLTETPSAIRTPSPELGQYNGEVFGSLMSMSSSNIQNLTQDGIF